LKKESELVAKVADLQNKIKENLQNSTLRDKADVGPLNDWLVTLRRKAITKSLEENPEGNFLFLSCLLFVFVIFLL
jgi:hypothetical protein